MAASGKALEEKNLKAIRELMKLPANKTCFDCSQKGPVYANLTIGTFICTACSGIHRELSHRVKSVSMSTFTSAEVEKLTEMGNEAATKIWHSRWNPSDWPAPDGNDASYLRKFIHKTYEEKAFCDKPGGGSSRKGSPGPAPTSAGKMPKKRRESKRSVDPVLPTPEPLSNILGPNIPTLDINGPSQSNGKSGRSPRRGHNTQQSNSSNNLIDLLDGSPTPVAQNTNKNTNNDLMSDLASLNFNSNTAPGYNATGAFNPFGTAPAPAPVVSQDQQQILQLQTQVQNMQNALMMAQQQMTACQNRIASGQAQFNSLNATQRDELMALTQRQRAMTQQYALMNQQYQAASTKLQQMMAASTSSNAFGSGFAAAFGPAPTSSNTTGSYNPPTNTGSYTASNNNYGYTASNNTAGYTASSNNNINAYGQQQPTASTYGQQPQHNPAYGSSSSSSNLDFFGSSSAANNSTNANLNAAFGTPSGTSNASQPFATSTSNGYGHTSASNNNNLFGNTNNLYSNTSSNANGGFF